MIPDTERLMHLIEDGVVRYNRRDLLEGYVQVTGESPTPKTPGIWRYCHKGVTIETIGSRNDFIAKLRAHNCWD